LLPCHVVVLTSDLGSPRPVIGNHLENVTIRLDGRVSRSTSLRE
jgi:hypothetical protein